MNVFISSLIESDKNFIENVFIGLSDKSSTIFFLGYALSDLGFGETRVMVHFAGLQPVLQNICGALASSFLKIGQ